MSKHIEQLTDMDLKAFDEAAKGYWFDDESEVITAQGFWRKAKVFYRDNPRLLSGENMPQGSITSVSAQIEKFSKWLGIELDEKTRNTLVMLWPFILDHKAKEAEDKAEASMETLYRVANFLKIDFDLARTADGKPSDIYIQHIHKFAENQLAENQPKLIDEAQLKANQATAALAQTTYAQVQDYRKKQLSPWVRLKRMLGFD